MFDKTIKIDVDGETVHLTNQQVVGLFKQCATTQVELDEVTERSFILAAERITMNTRLEDANAKLKEFGNPGQF